MKKSNGDTRRKFLKKTGKVTAAGAAASVMVPGKLAWSRTANVGGSDTVKIGLVGCGGRGTQAAKQAMNTEGNVELVAVGDVFENRLEQCLEGCNEKHPTKVRVNGDTKFVGLDAYKRVLDSGIDMVLLVTPPGFRPLHFESAIDAGKHVFMEKPVAVDAPGIRRILKSNTIAVQNNLAVAVGLQRRHERAYQETMEQLQDKVIGDIMVSRVYWNGNTPWTVNRKPNMTELQYQMRNWYFFNWMCGDHIVEQHIHNLDVINWLMDDFPVKAQGQGGRLLRDGKTQGQIYDHHMVEYTYANGHKMISQCRHMPECFNSVGEHVHGTKGHANVGRGKIFASNGELLFKAKGSRGGHQQEHHDLFADFRNGIMAAEGEDGAKSTMTAILGRLATYTGREIKWEDAINSNISLCNVDEIKSLNDEPPIKPNEDGEYWVPKPGRDRKKVIDF